MRGLWARFFPARRGVTVICAFNQRDKLERFLLPSLARQTIPHQLLLLDNTGGAFPCAARAFTAAAAQARYRTLMFVHQDVELGADDWLEKAVEWMPRLKQLGAAGVAGRGRYGTDAAVTDGEPPRLVGRRVLTAPARVQTLDGCLVLVPRKVLRKVPFDEVTVTGWHLLFTDWCLDLARSGLRCYVLPLPAYHQSRGPSDPGVYAVDQERILAKHRDHAPVVFTTVGVWGSPE